MRNTLIPRSNPETPDRIPDLRSDLPGWHLRALCRGMDPDLFFPMSGGEPSQKARDICGDCPVSTECLEDALEMGMDHGVWGGMSARDRRWIRIGEKPRKAVIPWKSGHGCTECGEPVKAHGYCNRHYQRWRRYGDPLGGDGAGAPRRIDLNRLAELDHLKSADAALLLGVAKQTVTEWRRRLRLAEEKAS